MSVSTTPPMGTRTVARQSFNILPYMVKRQTTVGFINSLCQVEGLCPTDLPPLDHYIDTDKFNNLLSPDSMFTDSIMAFTFEYAEYEVEVQKNGEVTVAK